MTTRSIIYAILVLSAVATIAHLGAAENGATPYLTEAEVKALITASEQRQFQIRKKLNADLIAQARGQLIPVYRFWSFKSGSQVLVFSDAERDKLMAYPDTVLAYEGLYGYIVRPLEASNE